MKVKLSNDIRLGVFMDDGAPFVIAETLKWLNEKAPLAVPESDHIAVAAASTATAAEPATESPEPISKSSSFFDLFSLPLPWFEHLRKTKNIFCLSTFNPSQIKI